MEVLSPKPQATPERQGRRRGRKPGNPMTARELAARRANLEKARAASRDGYRRTEKRLRASRANLEKAIAARRGPEGNASARLNALKHGLFAKQTLADERGPPRRRQGRICPTPPPFRARVRSRG